MRSPVTVARRTSSSINKRNMITRKYRVLDLSSVDVIVGSGCLVPVPEDICTVDADTPKLLGTVEWVCSGIEVLVGARRIDRVVNLSVILADLRGCLLTKLGSKKLK